MRDPPDIRRLSDAGMVAFKVRYVAWVTALALAALILAFVLRDPRPPVPVMALVVVGILSALAGGMRRYPRWLLRSSTKDTGSRCAASERWCRSRSARSLA